MASLKYNQKFHDMWAWSLTIKGATDEEIAQAFEVSVRTIHRWKKEHPTFLERLTEGKEIADATVERKLYERAIGYSYDEEERILEMDSDGRPKPIKVRTVSKHVPPDVMAQMYWLNNRKPDMYKRNPQYGEENPLDIRITTESMKEVEEFLRDGAEKK